MGWLDLDDRAVLVTGFANKKSVAWHVGRSLREAGARVVWSVRSEARRAELARLLPGTEPILVCDVERDAELDALGEACAREHAPLAGFVHSIAFAEYGGAGLRPFHETPRAEFLRAIDVSCHSLIGLASRLRPALDARASVVTISISTTAMAAENYGFMAPVKAALDSTVVFLAKSFSACGEVRFNAVSAGPLKTSASAGIPGYLESYLYAEQATLRKRALATQEVADVTLFLLSPRSSGINARGVVVDAGMGVNYFDRDLVRRATRVEEPS